MKRRIIFNIYYISKELMLIIFQPNVNKNPRLACIIVLLILTLTYCSNSQTQTDVVYTTLYTNCQITFKRIPNTTASNFAQSLQYQFKECKMSRCASLGTGSDCKEYSTIALEKQSCFWSCCRMDYFDNNQCYQNNSQLQTKTEQMDRYLIIILAICTLVLVFIILVFVVKDLKCFQKEQLPAKNLTPVWRQAKYQDHKCNICEQYGAVIETNCKHYFHIKCFKKEVGTKKITGQCLSCDQMSKKYRFWCSQCHEKYLKVGYSEMKTMDTIQKYYIESMVLHDDCLKDLYCCAKTDLRLTSSTND